MNAPEKPSLINALARTYEMDPQQFYAVIKSTVMPHNATAEQTAAFLMVAKEYGLSPMLKEIHAFAGKGGGIVPVISIDGWSSMVNRHPAFDGVEFEYDNGDNGVTAVTCRMWRKDRSRPIVVTEFMAECFRSTEPWNKAPARMLRHRAYIQAARLAFGFSGAFDEETVEIAAAGQPIDITPQDQVVIEQSKPRPPAAPKRAAKSAEKPAESDQAPAGQSDTARADDAIQRLATALQAMQTAQEIEEYWDAEDLAVQWQHDEDTLQTMNIMSQKAKKRLA